MAAGHNGQFTPCGYLSTVIHTTLVGLEFVTFRSLVDCWSDALPVVPPTKRCVLEQKLLLTAYRKSHMRIRLVQNEWHWPLFRGRLRSCQPLHHIRHWIYRKPLEIEAWFQRTTNRKWPMGNRMVTWDDVRWPRKVLLVTPIRLEPNISKTAGDAI